MTAWGWCIAEQADVPVGPGLRCETHGGLLIPPSFGDRLQVWDGSDWFPPAERPPGYVWVPFSGVKRAEAGKIKPRTKETRTSDPKACAYPPCGTMFRPHHASQRFCQRKCQQQSVNIGPRKGGKL